MPRISLFAAPAAAAVLAFAACGQSEEDKVRSTTDDFVSAFVDGDWGEVCSLLTDDARAQLNKAGALLGGASTCEKAMQMAGGAMSQADRRKLRVNKVKDISIKGDSATVTYVEGTAPTELRKNGGEWRIHARLGE